MDSKILEEAITAVCKDKSMVYGDPEEDFERVAGMLSALFSNKLVEGEVFEPYEVAMIMVTVKLSRMRVSPTKKDHWVDVAGYSECGFKCVDNSLASVAEKTFEEDKKNCRKPGESVASWKARYC